MLLDLKSEVKIISRAFTLYLGLKTQKTNLKAEKIDGTTLETYRIVVSTIGDAYLKILLPRDNVILCYMLTLSYNGVVE